jgi:outer membrane protein OmpA-like peptidoglycan-associated protein
MVLKLLLAMAVSPALLTAQSGEKGQLEIGAFGIYSGYDKTNIGLKSKLGAGAWAGFYVTDMFKIEALGDFTETFFESSGTEIRVARLGGAVLAHKRVAPLGTLYGGVGFERTVYRGTSSVDDNGGIAILGDRLSLGGRTAIRIEGRLSYIPNTNLVAASQSALSFSASVGISVFAFGGPPRDDDVDGVGNNDDVCPDTPSGALVDDDGCATDRDGDTVFDGLDQCPDTPDGASVDANGCPNDTDADGVLDGIDVCPSTPDGAAVDETGCPSDTDADGVLDGIDQCPATPTGAEVDSQGCPIDSDADGVFDGIDQCPGTPVGTVVDDTGCPLDTDADGIPDGSDACPDTPTGSEVDMRGCPIDTDADTDGVPDSVDECPDTAPGAVVDNRGCALAADSDGDGIPDSRDRCPDTAAGENVDAVGCPQLFQVEGVAVTSVVLFGVTFETSRSSLTASSDLALDRVAQSLLANPDVRIEIGGHTDATGSTAANRRLSLQRAQSVKAYLVRQGIRPDRLETVGYGPDEPIATNDTEEGRRQNRRVELTLLEGGASN